MSKMSLDHWPRLSESLPHPRRPDACQACGQTMEQADLLLRWQECDSYDRPEPIAVVLCKRCSDRLIEPHPRLYIHTDWWGAFPGAMTCCVDCALRDGLSCKSPLLKANGGEGLPIGEHVSGTGLACTRGKGCRQFKTYSAPPACKGRQPIGEQCPADAGHD